VVKIGLDMYLYKRAKNNKKAKILWKLTHSEKDKEIYYWRKCYEIHDIINELVCGVENCKDHVITKEMFKELIDTLMKSDDEIDYDYITDLIKIYKEVDWDVEEVYYYAWW
jgi:hypothetical protein